MNNASTSSPADKSSEYLVRACTPKEMSHPEFLTCLAILNAGGAVMVDLDKLKVAPWLAIARNGNDIVGVGAIKGVRRWYATEIAEKSSFDFPANTLELGYVAVQAAHKGKRLSHRILQALLAAEHGHLFATTDDPFMKRALATAGFIQKGNEWDGNRGCLSLWLKLP